MTPSFPHLNTFLWASVTQLLFGTHEEHGRRKNAEGSRGVGRYWMCLHGRDLRFQKQIIICFHNLWLKLEDSLRVSYFCVRVKIWLRIRSMIGLEVPWVVVWSTMYSKWNAQVFIQFNQLLENSIWYVNCLNEHFAETRNGKFIMSVLILSFPTRHKGTTVADITNSAKPGSGLRLFLSTTLSTVTTNQWSCHLRW